MKAIDRLRRDILREYAASIGLPSDASYITGAPLRPVVPLDIGSDVFIIGAYPSARFGVMNGERNVPVADNLGPFEPERYYDGEQVREQDSAAELRDYYLKLLGIDREKCWVTDLVKVTGRSTSGSVPRRPPAATTARGSSRLSARSRSPGSCGS